MIQSIRVTNYLGESITIELAKPELSGFLVKKISGLGPPKSNINVSQMATIDGGKFNSAIMDTRNIVLDLIFLEHPTIEDTRQMSYNFFPSKKQLKMEIFTDNRQVQTYGHVETNEPEIFSLNNKDLEGTSISIICEDPYFYSISDGENGDITTVVNGTVPLFEFEFENNSLSSDLIEMSEILDQPKKTLVYTGEIEIGILIEAHATGDVRGLIVWDLDTREAMKFNDDKLISLTGNGIMAGDTIIISTVKGNKYVHLIRAGVEMNIMNAIEYPIPWIQLRKGNNNLAYVADYGISNLEFIITHHIVYEGV